MKIGVLSDTHLDKVTGELRQIYKRHLADKDFILHAGDYVSTEVVEFLDRGNFHGVHGNMDPINVRKLLPEKKVIHFGLYRVGLIHGWGPSEGLSFRVQTEFQDVDVLVFGHAHEPMNHIRDGILFFNPGTAIGYRSSHSQTMGILELGKTIQGKIVPL